jgi:hypothetical protein
MGSPTDVAEMADLLPEEGLRGAASPPTFHLLGAGASQAPGNSKNQDHGVY